MTRPLHIYVVFLACLALVLAAMAWLTVRVIKLDRTEQQARRQAEIEENVRLALWRMDSALAPIIARESTRPSFAYQPFYAEKHAYTRMFAQLEEGDVQVPSPLLTQATPYILLHFQIGPTGQLTSPQVPSSNERDLAESYCTTYENIESSSAKLKRLAALVQPETLAAALPANVLSTAPAANDIQAMAGPANYGPASKQSKQVQRNIAEWGARNQSYNSSKDLQQAMSSAPIQKSALPQPSPDLTPGLLAPLWIGDALLLARRIQAGKSTCIQGCWMDWPMLNRWLVESVKDLLPNAALEPVRDRAEDRQGRMLAALPVRLTPGLVPLDPGDDISPVRMTLMIAWGCGLLAAVAVAVLLLGTVGLSERRGAFVSAVTHELRTPLTTFRMYTQMLADGMGPDAEKRSRYLHTLRIEADRLSHLVENVLSYARIERGRAAARVETLPCKELLERMRERLTERAGQAGMQVVIEPEAAAHAVTMRGDTTAVEQIIFNLIDNACKYAVTAADRRIVISAQAAGTSAVLRVRDFGPGIASSEARRLFRPFSKSARDAANSAPGVGLGLALSRRLAREMKGDLRIDPTIKDGACFILSLPQA